MQYAIVNHGGRESITVFIPGESGPAHAHDDHPSYDAIVSAARQDNADTVRRLIDVVAEVASRFQPLSERVSVKNGRVYFDGDEVDDSLTRQIVRFLNEHVDNWRPLVAFMENVAANPNMHSREQLYDWLSVRQGITITEDGEIVAYKGVARDSHDGRLRSLSSGTAIVDGEPVSGRIPNAVGSTVEMPRSAVAHDPGQACSTGLHVGTFEYAESWARNAMLEVLVNPRDVVSVPTDAGGEKIRVCRYLVQDIIDKPHTSALRGYHEDECECCGDYVEDCECGAL